MKVSKSRLGLYRSLYWANQSLLHAVRSLQEAEFPSSDILNDKLRRTQAMIEETRTVMNRMLADWMDGKE